MFHGRSPHHCLKSNLPSFRVTEKKCAHVDMQRYLWPGYEKQLLRELQKQQNNVQFCDTLLQTEGISVPTHSCILAALSPYLSHRLSTSPCPPQGQERQLELHSVKAHTLLKLTGLLYSGELVVQGSIERNDVLSAARLFGITNLVEIRVDGGKLKKDFRSCRQKKKGRVKNERRKMKDAQVQVAMAGWIATDYPVEKRCFSSTGTQTLKTNKKTSFSHSSPNESPAGESGSFVAQSLDFSITLQPQNNSRNKRLYSTHFPPIHSVASGASSDGESTLYQPPDDLTTSALASTSSTRFPISHNDESNSLFEENGSYHRSSEPTSSIQVLAKEVRALDDGKTNGEVVNKRDKTLGEEKGNSTEMKNAHGNVGVKNLAQMKQMIETTQISVKVKLRRRTKGEAWEVVSMQDSDDTLSVHTSLRQTGVSNREPSSVQVSPFDTPETQTPQPATALFPEPPPPLASTTSDSQPLSSSSGLTPDRNDDGSFAPPQPPGPVEDSDEQIEKLLEDIMMGLNILPGLERQSKASHHHHRPSHDGAPDVCQVTAIVNDRAMHADITTEDCVYYRDFGTQIDHSSTDSDVHQSSSSSLSSAQSDAVFGQHQQHSARYHPSATSMGQRDGTSHGSMPLPTSLRPEAAATTSGVLAALGSSGQRLHRPTDREQSSQEHQNNLEFLPLTNGNEVQSIDPLSLTCMDDLRLPQCLSPIEPLTSASKHHRIQLHNSAVHRGKKQLQSSLHGRPWLTRNAATLQFPLSAITHKETAQDSNSSCWSKKGEKCAEVNPQQTGTNGTESCSVNEMDDGGKVSAHRQSTAGVRSDLKKMKECLKCDDTKGDAAVSVKIKRKRRSQPQDAAGSPLAGQDVKAIEQINLSVCSVSLSNNNVLAKERKMACFSDKVKKFEYIERSDEPSTITIRPRKKTRGDTDLDVDQSQIRTRGFLKKTQDSPSNTHLKKTIRQEAISTPRKRCGRPLKRKRPEESLPGISEEKSHGAESEQQLDNSLPKEEEEEEDGGKSEIRCKKWRCNRSEMKEIPLERTASAERASKAEAGDDDAQTSAERGSRTRLQRVTLKDFQKLIKRQHWKTRKSQETRGKKTNETRGQLEGEGTASGSRCETQVKEAQMDVTQPPSEDGVDENHNHPVSKSRAECGKSQPGDTNSCAREQTSLFRDGEQPAFSSDVLGEEEAELRAERRQPETNPDEAQNTGVSGTTQPTAINDEDPSHSDINPPPQEYKIPLDHNLNPQTPERPGPSTLDPAGCDQEDEEEVEVDVILYSPDKAPQARQGETGLDNVDLTPEEDDDEEDMTEIDVTGDEAE